MHSFDALQCLYSCLPGRLHLSRFPLLCKTGASSGIMTLFRRHRVFLQRCSCFCDQHHHRYSAMDASMIQPQPAIMVTPPTGATVPRLFGAPKVLA